MSALPFLSSTRFVLMMALLSGLTTLGIDMVPPATWALLNVRTKTDLLISEQTP